MNEQNSITIFLVMNNGASISLYLISLIFEETKWSED